MVMAESLAERFAPTEPGLAEGLLESLTQSGLLAMLRSMADGASWRRFEEPSMSRGA